MHDAPPPRDLPERTGKHSCVKCLAPVAADEYFRNDHLCDACAGEDEYPLKSTPEPKTKR
ncbi:MAG TPA: hypothetical protein VND45_13410 [Thermoanaerobaculia bacterium]|nr:hypothetical protein [Thermoanaerobaculia bacterium]